MTPTWKKAAVVALVMTAACARNDTNTAAAESDVGTPASTTAEGQMQAPATAAEATNAAENAAATAGSILAWSRPAAGSTVSAPVNELVFHFTPPARLHEVTVTGPEGAMPVMVTAVGEVEHYSLPLSGVGSGRYTVDWRATARGVDHQGSFGFEVR